jgi:hypothetical protein
MKYWVDVDIMPIIFARKGLDVGLGLSNGGCSVRIGSWLWLQWSEMKRAVAKATLDLIRCAHCPKVIQPRGPNLIRIGLCVSTLQSIQVGNICQLFSETSSIY